MSFQSYKWVWALRGLQASERVVLFCLAEHENGGTCWPSQARIAALTELSVRTVQRAMHALERRGLIQISGGDYRRLITLNLTAGGVTPCHAEATPCQEGGDTVSDKHDTVTYQSLKNPLSESLKNLADKSASKNQGETVKVSEIHAAHDKESSDLEILARVKLTKADKPIPRKASVVTLYRALSAKYWHQAGPALTTKAQVGQIGLLVAKVEGPSVRAVYYALREWHGFCAYVEKANGLFSSPALPHPGFLLKHCWLAVGYAAARDAEAAKPAQLLQPGPPKTAPVLTNALESPDTAAKKAKDLADLKELLSKDW